VRIAVCLLLLPLAACDTPSRPNYAFWAPKTYQAEQIAAAKIYAPDRIDGSYQGTAYLTSAPNMDRYHWWRRPKVSDELCPRTTAGVVEIDSHTLYYAFTPGLSFAAPVAADGTIVQTLGDAKLSGKVRHDRLTFNIVTPVCTSRFFGDFKLNHS
jgi:hypothetical protein